MIGNHFTKEILGQLVTDINIAFWVWDIENDSLMYNEAFFELVGYSEKIENFSLEAWNSMIHDKDRERVEQSLNDYLDGTSDTYLVELRIVKDDGEVVWLQDSGKATRFDENGEMLAIAGITQDITQRKQYEEKLREEEEKLKLAMQIVNFSVWDWNVNTNLVNCSEGYVKSLGYDDEEWFNSVDRWMTITHPDDTIKVRKKFDEILTGKCTAYDHKIRIRKRCGEFIWVRDVGKVSRFDDEGRPSQLIGGRIDINELELASLKLEEAQEDLENQILQRTQELTKRDKVLFELNQITQNLMATPTGENFNNIVYDYLEEFTSVQQASRLAIFRNKWVDDRIVCYLDNDPKSAYRTKFSLNYIRDVFKDVSVEFLSEGFFAEDQREEFYNVLLENISKIDMSCIDYMNDFPLIYEHVITNEILNTSTEDLPAKEFIFTHLQGLKTIAMSPIFVNGDFWGFIMFDDYENKVFNKEDEKTLTLVGSVVAQAIHKNELELIAKEAIEHNDLMLNALPIGCSLWENNECIYVNDEVIRLFNLNDGEEFKQNFHIITPRCQPCGRLSQELFEENMIKVIEEGWHRFEWVHVDLQGVTIPCEITLVKIRYSGKDLIAGYSRDLREFKALIKDIEESKEHLRLAHEEALLSSKAKSNFLANMSHEIRTPMNAISGMTDIILRETTDNEVVEYAVSIKRACDSLLSIINDVLDISKIESGKIDIVEGEYKLENVLNDVLTIATNRLELKNLMFTSNLQSNLPNELIGDDIRIKQIMVNLLNNAIKFTSEGSIAFNVSGDFAGGLLELKFSITDTGAGISQEDIEKLFIEFERVNTKKNRTIEGTGLGLAISKRLCEMMNGEIQVTSELGVGSTFSVSVLQKFVNYTPLAKIDKPKSILVFESRDLYRNSIEEACNDLQLTDTKFCSLQSEFNEALQEREFDFIFTSAMYLLKVQEMLTRHNSTEHSSEHCKIILLADNADIKSKYNYTTIVVPTNSISISNVINGKVIRNEDSGNASSFTAPACHVLVVDDNLVNIKVAQGLMRPYQFKISTAENGQEAVEKVKNNQYDMVFMDHMMPIMDGIDATTAIRNLEGEYYQNVPIIALTANAIIGTKEMFIREGMNDFLAKPIKLTALNDILAKWLPKDKQISDDGEGDLTTDNPETKLNIENINTTLGIQRVGGDFETYIDILNMYYKDGLKRIPHIRDLYDKKETLGYKIEVHALKSASASVGAIDISEKARMLEEAAIKEDWVYIGDNTLSFINEFDAILESTREALKGLIKEVDNTGKELGDKSLLIETLQNLCDALDSIDINLCDTLIEKIFNFNWDNETLSNLIKIKDFITSYEYDEAVEVINTLIS